jgi:hypothetical protein
MSGFLFNRRISLDNGHSTSVAPQNDQLLKDAGQAQAIATAAICATLVSKSVLSAAEGAELMSQIAGAVERDVVGLLGASAGDTLRCYSRALSSAAE